MKGKGVIKRYFDDGGFGFIRHQKEDLFFHISDVGQGDKQYISKGIEVTFDIGKGRNGKPAAKNVVIISKNELKLSYCIPEDTLSIIDIHKIDNFNLLLNKAALFTKDKFQLINMGESKRIEYKIKPNFDNINFTAIISRQSRSISKLNIFKKKINYLPDWRFVVGLGEPSVYETSITLHYIYGIPYIPASAIKGITRSWIISELFNNDEDKALKDVGFCYIFGATKASISREKKGAICFFDAYPVETPQIRIDIMNPHYVDYYSDTKGEKPPGDYYNPVPIYFLTIENTHFDIIIGTKEEDNKKICNSKLDGYPLDTTEKWVKKALNEHGIGAKTSVGYGYNSCSGKLKVLD